MTDPVLQEIAELKVEIKALTVEVAALKLTAAADAVRFEMLKAETASMRKVLNWVAAMIISGFMAALISLVMKGGIPIG